MDSWIETHRGETVVVKFGGNAMMDDELTSAFCNDIVALTRAGIRTVVTHGGGPQISTELAVRGIHSEFRGGLRVTTADAIQVVRDVLVRIGSELADGVNASGLPADALAGDAHGLFSAVRAGTVIDGTPVDIGQVGEIVSVDTTAVRSALDAGRVPVVSAIARNAIAKDATARDVHSGDLLNINADAAASSLAVALGADWLILLTDVAGLYRDWPNRESLVTQIDSDELEALMPKLESGMIPKMAAARTAVLGGVGRAVVVDGRVPHVLVAEPFGTSGTTVTQGERVAP